MAEKIKKKQFIKIIAPANFNEQAIGESLVNDASVLIGRKMKINLMTLTNDPRSQNVQVSFEMTGLKGNSVMTEMVGYTVSPSFIKRLVRKDKTKIDHTFNSKTKDNVNIVLKPLILTLNKTSRSVETALRNTTQQLLNKKVSTIAYTSLMNEIISQRLQREIKKQLSKVYPVRHFDIREVKVLSKEDYVEEEKTTEAIHEAELKEKTHKVPAVTEKKLEDSKEKKDIADDVVDNYEAPVKENKVSSQESESDQPEEKKEE